MPGMFLWHVFICFLRAIHVRQTNPRDRESSTISIQPAIGLKMLVDESRHLLLQMVKFGIAREPPDHGLFLVDRIGISSDHFPFPIADLTVRPC